MSFEVRESAQSVALCVDLTATQSIANNVITAVSWNVQPLWNRGFTWTGGTTVTFPEPGLYSITWDLSYATGVGTNRLTYLTRSGDTLHRWGQTNITPVAGVTTRVVGACILNMLQGSTASIFVFQNSGGALNIGGATDPLTCEWSIAKIANVV